MGREGISNTVVFKCPASLHAPQIKPIMLMFEERENLLIEHG